MHELSKGGFGLVWSDDEYFDRYYSMNQPYKLGTNLAAGIPVIVKEAVFMRNLSKETVWDMQSIRWMKLINGSEYYGCRVYKALP